MSSVTHRGASPVEAARGEESEGCGVKNYDFDQIDQAAKDAEAGIVVKPVLRIA